jgi:hypothetical protein
MEYEKYIGINLVDYSDAELIKIRNLMDFEYGEVTEEWTRDLQALDTPNFDPYSFWGGKKLDKVTKKYAGVMADISLISERIENELEKRGKFAEEQRYSGKSKVTNKNIDEDEFLEKEELKTLLHRQDIDEE